MLKIIIHIQIIIEYIYIYIYIYHNPIFIYDNIYLVNFSYSLNVLADDLLSIMYYNMINNT